MRVVPFGGIIERATETVLRLAECEQLGTVPFLVVEPTL